MKNFHSQPWDSKWNFAEKFKDPRLRFFAAKHIFRNLPEALPKKVFLYLHKKVSERIFSLEKKSFLFTKYLTLPLPPPHSPSNTSISQKFLDMIAISMKFLPASTAG